MSTRRQRWSQKRNWLLFRLKGILPLFSCYNDFIYSLLPEEKHYVVDMVYLHLDTLMCEIANSKYKE